MKKPNKQKIHRYIELSTAHISKDTAQKLSNSQIEYNSILARKYEYGFYIHILQDLKGEKPPNDLKEIVNYAQKKGVELLILDRDCEKTNELRTYEW